MCFSCNIFKYGENIKEDTDRILQTRKKEFRELGFNGIVETKIQIKNNKLAPYRLILKIDNTTETLTINNVQTPPYYLFDSLIPQKLELSVSEEIYNATNKGDRVFKSIESDSIQIDTTKFELLKPSSNSNWN